MERKSVDYRPEHTALGNFQYGMMEFYKKKSLETPEKKRMDILRRIPYQVDLSLKGRTRLYKSKYMTTPDQISKYANHAPLKMPDEQPSQLYDYDQFFAPWARLNRTRYDHKKSILKLINKQL